MVFVYACGGEPPLKLEASPL